jgi:hypothetical protein
VPVDGTQAIIPRSWSSVHYPLTAGVTGPSPVPPACPQEPAPIRTQDPDWQPWLTFFLRSLAEQVRRLEKKVEREKRILAVLPELALQIVEFAREHGRVTMGDVIKLTGASRNTLNEHFRTLVERGPLNPQGAGRGVWYELR